LLPRFSPSSLYTLSLHDALPIWDPVFPSVSISLGPRFRGDERERERTLNPSTQSACCSGEAPRALIQGPRRRISPHAQSHGQAQDRKSTRLNSSHQIISYAVFCL